MTYQSTFLAGSSNWLGEFEDGSNPILGLGIQRLFACQSFGTLLKVPFILIGGCAIVVDTAHTNELEEGLSSMASGQVLG